MRKRNAVLWSLAIATLCMVAGPTGCVAGSADEAATIDDQGDDVDAVGPNEEATLTSDESESDDETPAKYAAADLADDMTYDVGTFDPTADDDEGTLEDFDGLPDVREAEFPVDAIPESVQAAIPTKIKYVMVLVKENHTFDNYFTGFPGASWSKKAKVGPGDVECRPFAPDGAVKTPCHSNCCGRHAYDKGAMDGFHHESSACGGQDQGLYPFIRYTKDQIPNYWKLASEYVLADHYFSTTLGPSSPGHEVFWFSQSTSIDNAKCTGKSCSGSGCGSVGETITAMNPLTCTTQRVKPCFDLPSLPDHLPKGFTWMDYGGPMASQIKWVSKQSGWKSHFRGASKLVSDLKAGHLANLTIAHLSGGPISEHPPENPCLGENFTVDVINAAMKLPQWNEMAILVTWDDWGGFYDHVKPSVHVCKNGKEFENGFRLPLIIVSPYAKKGFVLKDHVEQASVPKLVEELWGMKLMHTRNKHARDGVAGSLLPAFDFKQKPRAPIKLTPRASCPSDKGRPATLHFPKMVGGECP